MRMSKFIFTGLLFIFFSCTTQKTDENVVETSQKDSLIEINEESLVEKLPEIKMYTDSVFANDSLIELIRLQIVGLIV